MIARDEARLEALAAEVPDTRAYPCNVAKAEDFAETLRAIEGDLGPARVAIHNAVGGSTPWPCCN